MEKITVHRALIMKQKFGIKLQLIFNLCYCVASLKLAFKHQELEFLLLESFTSINHSKKIEVFAFD